MQIEGDPPHLPNLIGFSFLSRFCFEGLCHLRSGSLKASRDLVVGGGC